MAWTAAALSTLADVAGALMVLAALVTLADLLLLRLAGSLESKAHSAI